MISESEYSHNAFGNLMTFKDIFTSFFFVSIGMLFNVAFVQEHITIVLLSVCLVFSIKTIIAAGTGFILGHTFKGTVLIGVALSQVGEFSFILAKIGLGYGIIDSFIYQLFLAVALITMAATPFLMGIAPAFSKLLLQLPLPDKLIQGLFPLQEIEIPKLQNHLVIIGKDPSAFHVSNMAAYYSMKHVSIVFDPDKAREKIARGENAIYGDAINEPILHKAHIETADVIFLSIGDIIPTMAIIEKIRHLNSKAHIIVRTKHLESVEQLYNLGADQVFPERFELAVGVWNRILLQKQYPQKEINKILTQIRIHCLGNYLENDTINKPSLLQDISHISISALVVQKNSKMIKSSILESNLRKHTGATILAVKRRDEIIEHPTPNFVLLENDICYLLGNENKILQASEYFNQQ